MKWGESFGTILFPPLDHQKIKFWNHTVQRLCSMVSNKVDLVKCCPSGLFSHTNEQNMVMGLYLPHHPTCNDACQWINSSLSWAAQKSKEGCIRLEINSQDLFARFSGNLTKFLSLPLSLIPMPPLFVLFCRDHHTIPVNSNLANSFSRYPNNFELFSDMRITRYLYKKTSQS